VHYKSSTEAKAAPIGFALVAAEVPGAAGVCRVGRLEWTGATELTKETMLAAPSTPDTGTDKQTLIAKAKFFLQTALADGARPLQDLIAEAAGDGLKEHHLIRAAKDLRIIIRSTNDFPRRTVWSLRPKHLAPVVTAPTPRTTVPTVTTVTTESTENPNKDNSSDSGGSTDTLFESQDAARPQSRRPRRGDRREAAAAFQHRPPEEK